MRQKVVFLQHIMYTFTRGQPDCHRPITETKRYTLSHPVFCSLPLYGQGRVQGGAMIMADLSGQQFGNYRLLRVLGQGGQASVYLGQHLRLQQKFAAIKILHARVSEQDIDAFQQEANTIATLQHPHIVNVLDFDVQQGIPFLVMEYYPGGSLRQRHPRGERVPLPTVISYVKQVAEALQYAHAQRLIHRDVKAANMLIGPKREIVLSDFGIATIAHSTSSIGTHNFAGTAPYMAPEQIR